MIPSRLFAALSRAALRPTATQLTAAMGVLAALALTGSLVVTGLAVQTDQRADPVPDGASGWQSLMVTVE